MALEYDLLMRASVFTCKATMSDAMAGGKVTTVGHRDRILNWLACFDHPALVAQF